MIIYLAKVSIAIAIFYLFYRIFLEKESFYRINRIYLLLSLAIAVAVPVVTLPSLIEDQGYVSTILEEPLQNTVEKSKEGSQSLAIYQQEKLISRTVDISKPKSSFSQQLTSIKTSRPYGFWFLSIYAIGALILLIHLLLQIFSTISAIRSAEEKISIEGAIIIKSSKFHDACSFFKYIFINSENYESETYKQILDHEKIHVRKRHSWDLIVAELAVVVFWVNPFIWLMRRSIMKNIEFQTDELIVNREPDLRQEYQFSLLKVATSTRPLQITTNYNQSLIKQRILKMNKSKSSIYNAWKYAFLAPTIVALLLALNKPQDQIVEDLSAAIIEQSDSVLEGVKEEQTIIPREIIHTSNQEEVKDAIVLPGHREESANNTGDLESNCKTLINAVNADDLKLVKSLLDIIDVNCINEDPDFKIVRANNQEFHMRNARTALVAAAREGHFEIGKLLIEQGAEIDLHASGDGSPLMEAAKHGFLDFVKLLVEKNADLNLKILGEGTPLMSACKSGNIEIVNYISERGAEVNTAVLGDGTALIIASQLGHLDIVKYLVAQGASINVTVSGDGSALSAAAQGGHTKVVEYLLEQNADIGIHTPGDGTAIIAAARNGDIEMVKFLKNKGADLNFASPGEGSALTVAVRGRHKQLVEYLIGQGANIDLRVPGEGAALTIAARDNNRSMVEYLLSKDANINVAVPGEGTALSLAARNGHQEMVVFLLERGAIVDHYGAGESSPLGCAVRNGHYEIAKILMENGADPNFAPPGDEEPYYYAVKQMNKEMIALLEKK